MVNDIRPAIVKFCRQMQPRIHKQNVDRGWWDDPRNDACFVCLFHSEASEGLEGVRKNLNDDKLTQYPMVVVEMVDCFIRVLDYCGYKKWEWSRHHIHTDIDDDVLVNIANIHEHLSNAWTKSKKHPTELAMASAPLMAAASLCYRTVVHMGYDFEQIVCEKLSFNLTRPDHDKATRTSGKPGAKGF